MVCDVLAYYRNFPPTKGEGEKFLLKIIIC